MTTFQNTTTSACVAVACLLMAGTAQAAVQLSSTRAIMNETDRNVSVYARNMSAEPFVVQAWIDGDDEEMETPFFISPPLSRFDGNAERSLNITRVGEDDLPKDRESYYWINVLEIPQKTDSDENSLMLATRTRIKLFYRPNDIQKLPRGAELLKWSMVRDGGQCQLVIENTSAYNINFASIDMTGESSEFGRALIAKPLETTQVPLGHCPVGAVSITPHVVNDYGVVESWSAVAPTLSGAPVTGVPAGAAQ